MQVYRESTSRKYTEYVFARERKRRRVGWEGGREGGREGDMAFREEQSLLQIIASSLELGLLP
jgi:hypothetical protein